MGFTYTSQLYGLLGAFALVALRRLAGASRTHITEIELRFRFYRLPIPGFRSSSVCSSRLRAHPAQLRKSKLRALVEARGVARSPLHPDNKLVERAAERRINPFARNIRGHGDGWSERLKHRVQFLLQHFSDLFEMRDGVGEFADEAADFGLLFDFGAERSG